MDEYLTVPSPGNKDDRENHMKPSCSNFHFRPVVFGTVTLLCVVMPHDAYAGMSTVTLSRFGMERLIGLSTVLFLLVVVVATTLTYCWNRLVKDTNWPRLTHPKAIGFAFLAGLLSFLVLVMIAGSRELLSPGAWKPKGILYELADKPGETPEIKYDAEMLVPEADTPEARLAVRRESLARLRAALWKYADEHGGTFPKSLPESLEAIPVSGGLKYRFFPKPSDDDAEKRFLVLETDMNEPPQLALDRQGMIVEVRP